MVTQTSPPAEKIRLFRSLFQGRTDVYPVRFENKRTGKAGYSPACANEWARGSCEKPRVKCADCPARSFLPVTDEVIRRHLSGEGLQGKDFVMGIYPMLLDETCHFLAADFDKESWQEDASAYRATCHRFAIPAALERSRSGNGAHVWLFFEEAIPAAFARKLGTWLLTETMENRPELGFSSYDRFFPNQDTLPKGGFGNLIALPLQKQARLNGNTLFVDDAFHPHPDQWTFLSAVGKISRAQTEKIVSDAESRGRVVGVRVVEVEENDETPWAAPPSHRRKDSPIPGPLPETIKLVLGDQIYIEKEHLPPPLRNRLLRVAAFQNPEFYRAQAMRLPVYDKPRIIHCAEDYSLHFGLPRGCLEEIIEVLEVLKIKPILQDERCIGTPLDVSFCGTLHQEQQAAADAMLQHDTGVLSATTAFGKTVLAAWLIAKRSVSTLILVHRQQLLEQWIERLSTFLGVPGKTIGRLGGGRKKLNGALDVALIQSLVRKVSVRIEKRHTLAVLDVLSDKVKQKRALSRARCADDIQRKLGTIKAKLARIEAKQPTDQVEQPFSPAVLKKRWPEIPPQLRRDIVRSFVHRIVVSDDEIEFSYRFRDSSERTTKHQHSSSPTNSPLPSDEPLYIRLPKAGQRCPRTGITRSALNELILPSERNSFNPPVESKCLRKREGGKGTRLIVWQSLKEYLENRE